MGGWGQSRRHRLAVLVSVAPLLLGSLAPPGALAAGNVISLDLPSGETSKGDALSVDVVSQADVFISGASASIAFDRSRLAVVTVTVSKDWLGNGAMVAGVPTATTEGEFVADANAAGKVPLIAAFFVDGKSLPAGGHELMTVTFRVLSCGVSRIEPQAGPEGVLLDGRKDSYGKTLEVTSAGAALEVPCKAGETPAPAATPEPSVAEGAGLASGSCPIWFDAEGGNLVDWILEEAEVPFEITPIGSWTDLTILPSTTEPLANLQAGQFEVAGSDRRLNYYGGESDNLYAWKIGTDSVTGRSLYLAVRKFTVASRTTPDDSALVIGDDFVNYMLTAAGQAHVAAANFGRYTPVGAAASPPIPDYDISLDGVVALGDIGEVTGHWAETSPCVGWIRGDANNDGTVALGDIGIVTGKWGQIGFVPPPATPAPGTRYGFAAYTFGDSSCTGSRKDPLNLFYSGPELGTVAGALAGTRNVLGFIEESFLETTQWFQYGNCTAMADGQASGALPPKYHARLSVSVGGIVASPQHHDVVGFCPLPQDVSDTFNGARDHAEQLWDAEPGVTIAWHYWGNTDAMRQCDGRYTASDGWDVTVNR